MVFGPHSIRGWCFFVEKLSSLQDPIFWYFPNFQRLVRVRYAYMINKTPSGGVVCCYCHNPGHVSRNCGKLYNKNRRFQSVHYPKSLKSASTSITTLVESGKTNTCFLSSFST